MPNKTCNLILQDLLSHITRPVISYYNKKRGFYFYFLSLFFVLLQMNWGLHIGFPAFQSFKHFSQEYSDSFALVVRLIHSFFVGAGTSSSVFYFYYYCLLESENNLCTFHMGSFLSSPSCLINIQSWHV